MRSAQRLRAGIHDAASAAADGAQFREFVMDVLGAYIPYDGGCVAPVDPAVGVPTGFTTRGLDDPAEILEMRAREVFVDRLDFLKHHRIGLRCGQPCAAQAR